MKKPIYKYWWFWLIVVCVSIGIIAAVEGADQELESDTTHTIKAEETTKETPKKPSTKYTVVSVSKLVSDLDSNALNAKDQYDGAYVEITGRVDVIDASGKYICLYPADDEWAITGVQCFIEKKEQKEFVKTISTGDVVTLKGKITMVGEIMGYSLDIHEFVK